MGPEFDAYFRAVVRAMLLAFVVVMAVLPVCLALNSGPVIFAAIATPVAIAVLIWRPWPEHMAMRRAARERRERVKKR